MSMLAINKALREQLYTIATANSWKVVYENEPLPNGYDPTLTETFYLTENFLPAETQTIEVGTCGRNRNIGLYQINIYVQTHLGTNLINSTFETIRAAFKRGATLTHSSVDVNINNCYREGSDFEEPWTQTPVIVAWRSDNSN